MKFSNDCNQQSSVELVAPDPANGHAYVDLGLRSGGNKILFATMNVGASAPQEFGDYFAWGETSKRYSYVDWDNGYLSEYQDIFYPIVGGTFSEDNAPFFGGWEGEEWSSPKIWTKYNVADNKKTLDPVDDVASVIWGGAWRMPDKADLEYLFSSYCTFTLMDDYNSTGVAGVLITGKGDYADNSIFLPFAGDNADDIICCESSNGEKYGNYWLRSLFIDTDYDDDVDQAGMLLIMLYSENTIVHDWTKHYRCYAKSVRPVLVVPE